MKTLRAIRTILVFIVAFIVAFAFVFVFTLYSHVELAQCATLYASRCHLLYAGAMQRCTRRFYGSCKAIKCQFCARVKECVCERKSEREKGRKGGRKLCDDYAKLCIEYLLGIARKLHSGMPASLATHGQQCCSGRG